MHVATTRLLVGRRQNGKVKSDFDRSPDLWSEV
jgi:hypothetical protein